MARSWRNFFRKSTDEEQGKGPAVASEPAPEEAQEGNGHHPEDLEPEGGSAEGVPTAEEVQAERKEPAAEDVWEVEEPAPGGVEEDLPGPTMFAAGDTFRAAAIEQLQKWGERTGTPVVARVRGADAAAVAHEAIQAARREGTDVLLIDTAGRLHTKINLMAELDK